MALTPGTASLTSASATSIVVATTVATGGSGTYAYQWLRSVDGGSTWPLVGGATSTTLTDSSVTPGFLYYYKCQVTDTSPAAVVDTNTITGFATQTTPTFLQDDSGGNSGVVVNISAADQSFTPIARGLWVSVAGAVKVDMVGVGTGLTYNNVPVGWWACHISKLYKTGTTATVDNAVW